MQKWVSITNHLNTMVLMRLVQEAVETLVQMEQVVLLMAEVF